MTTAALPIRRELGGHLCLCTPRGEEDIERVAKLNTEIHGPGVGDMLLGLMHHYPGIELADLLFVEDERTGKAVSTLLLIPWTLCYEGVRLPTGEMGLVATAEQYRRRGLVRAQVETFKDRLRQRGCSLSIIQGIPYFYRQFGYEYAIPLEGGLRLSGRELPPSREPAYSFRLATLEDVATLVAMYDGAADDLAIHTVRALENWRYQLRHTPGTEMEAETWLIQDAAGKEAGYLRLPLHHFGEELTVGEVSRLSFDAALAALRWLVCRAGEQKLPGVRLNLPASCTLMRLAKSLGAHDLGTYAWQIHVLDLASLLRALAPALEHRIAASPFAGFTGELHLCFYRESVRMVFDAGRLKAATNAGPAEGEINLPPLAFVPLLLGHRSLDELRKAYPDVDVAPAWRLLVETLFPTRPAFLLSPY